MEYLQQCRDLPVNVIDRSSPGMGWKGTHSGVGWARKTVMDVINENAASTDIIISMDADTTFGKNYLRSVRDMFLRNPGAAGLSVPYYHRLTDDEVTDRCILRYEIYMRYYALNMWRIGNPYKFTAIGSAMACPVRAYRAVGGITPHKSGEDFYFLQKLAKYGNILHWSDERMYPAARFSNRVFFGTGPAMIKGREGDWSSYPIYDHLLFNEVMATYECFHGLYDTDVETLMSGFLRRVFGTDDLWGAMRKNYKSREQFRMACIRKVDGLRILQYLKARQREIGQRDEENLREFLKIRYQISDIRYLISCLESLDFSTSPVHELDAVRNFLAEQEERERCSDVAM